MATERVRVGVVALSSKVPEVEFGLGIQKLRELGFDPWVHPHCLNGHLFFAGTDAERAEALLEYAYDPKLPVIWAARGGYGAARLLPLLERAIAKRKKRPPNKLLVGFSDVTAVGEFLRRRWGWRLLHAPMPGLREFCLLSDLEYSQMVSLVRGPDLKTTRFDGLKFYGGAPKRALQGELVGGNLAVWSSLVGTPYEVRAKNKILFLEDVGENLYRIDRMARQLVASRALAGVQAIVLGNFKNCTDLVPSVLKRAPSPGVPVPRNPPPEELAPLRPVLRESEGLAAIFIPIARDLKIPIAYGLPVGHGPERSALPLGAVYELHPSGSLRLREWAWRGPHFTR